MTTGGDNTRAPDAVERAQRRWTGYLAAVLTTAAVTAVGWPLHHRFGLTSTDVLMPPIETCRACHQGEHARAAVPSTCIMCHVYHREDLEPMLPRATASGR